MSDSTAFPRIITLLRKEQGLSQKQVSGDLGISQALLSHYEKGIRECKLSFVVKIADYYHVSCDYLLGRTAEKTGAVIEVEDIPENDPNLKDNQFRGSLLPTLNKKLVVNSVNIIFDILQRCNNKAITTEVSSYLSIAVYSAFRQLYTSNKKNPDALFSVKNYLFSPLVYGELARTGAVIGELAKGGKVADYAALEPEDAPVLSPDILAEQYPLFASSLLNLLKNAETRLKGK